MPNIIVIGKKEKEEGNLFTMKNNLYMHFHMMIIDPKNQLNRIIINNFLPEYSNNDIYEWNQKK